MTSRVLHQKGPNFYQVLVSLGDSIGEIENRPEEGAESALFHVCFFFSLPRYKWDLSVKTKMAPRRIAILDKRSFYFYVMHLYWKHMLEAKVIFFTDNESYNWFEQFLKTWLFYHSLWLVELEETPHFTK